jgi:hypothetical protein
MSEPNGAARTLLDHILAAMVRFETRHGVRCDRVRMNRRDYNALVWLAAADVTEMSFEARAINHAAILLDDRVEAPLVGATMEVPIDVPSPEPR